MTQCSTGTTAPPQCFNTLSHYPVLFYKTQHLRPSAYNHITSFMVMNSTADSARALSSEQAVRGFAACGSIPRLAVLRFLVRAGEGGLTVSQIQQRSKLPASTLAHHLRLLTESGLVEQERRGRKVINRAEFRRIESLSAYLTDECCADAHPAATAAAKKQARKST